MTDKHTPARRHGFVAALTLIVTLAVTLVGGARAAEVRPLTPECEAALAVSAMPATLRDDAGVLVLGREGFETVRDGSGPFRCLVARNHRDSLIPQCFDEPGTRAILPRFMAEGRMIRSQEVFLAIKERIDMMMAAGEFKAVDRPGLVYMMSPYNYIFAERRGEVVHVPPHVMFHAPNLSASDVGNSLADGMHNHGVPFVIDEGPHGYMITMVNQAADASQAESVCKGQLPARPKPLG